MSLIDCAIHGKNRDLFIINDNKNMCLDCYGEELIIKNQQNIDVEILLSRQKDAYIPSRYRKSSLDNYNPNCIKSKELLTFCKNYEFNTNVLFLGTTGTGKSHLGCSLLTKALSNGMTGLYIKYYQLADLKIKNYELFQKIFTCQFLVLDEYGQQESDFKSNLLFEIIDQRYDNEVQTTIISNYKEDEFLSKEKISDQLFSRLTENTILHECLWEDYRLKKVA